ncbi:MAG TPA: glycoside hydrolase family 15 protein [Bacteriovoracaceae bacterium]|nr:glycoside hydrolase family 15 protein [Bacteriovoracaceae bacterium]
MKFLALMLLPAFIFSAAAQPNAAQPSAAQPSKEFQFNASIKTVIENSTMPDVRPGMVVASPSRSNPDYYFDWLRDTALTMRSLIDYYELKKDPAIKKMIFTWIDAEIHRQNLPTLTGLGEPKFNVDGSGYTGPWGRPQNDGPALRALAIIKFARILLKEGNQDYVIKKLFHGTVSNQSVIQKDLDYTVAEWKKPSFDLWEEEQGMHFYTLLAQHTALQEGGKLAHDLSDHRGHSTYQAESEKIGTLLKREFSDANIGILATRNKVNGGLSYKKSNLDVAPLLALLHNSPYQKLFPLNGTQVRRYVDGLAVTFTNVYAVNKNYPELGVAIGRYPEDRYDGYQTSGSGNPWFLSTLALGEYMCLLRTETKSQKMNDMIEKQFSRALFHSDRKGSMSEQFNSTSGLMQGARQLTWSHNAFMTAMMRCGLVK